MMVDSEKTITASAISEDMDQYLKEIREVPLLSAQEERELAKRCMAGDEEAIRSLVKANLRLVVHIAKEYAGRGVPLMDLIQEGSIGLIAAARKFDYSLDFRFSTYATKWIRQGVTRCLMNNESVIRVPIHTAEKMKKVCSVRDELRKRNEEEPSLSEIANQLGISEDTVQELLLLSPEVCSLDVPAGEDEKTTLGDMMADLEDYQPHEAMIRHELERIMQDMLANLNDRQKRILMLHFGFEDGIVHSLDEIGKMLGISKERTRQIERQAITKMQKMGDDFGLGDFL